MQKKFVFSKNSVVTIPKFKLDSVNFDLKGYVKDKMIKEGYLVKYLKEEETVTVTCTLAKANVSLKERYKLQSQIDSQVESNQKIINPYCKAK